MKLFYDIWPPYQPLTEEELEHLQELGQTRYENDADNHRKGE